MTTLYTIGFTKKKAKQFFTLVKEAQIKRLFDVRLHNVSQLAGFAKKADLAFFLKELCDVQYVHATDLAPTDDLLKAYKRKEITWESYADSYLNLMSKRRVERAIAPEEIDNTCLLCSEHLPHHCHRRLLAEYLGDHFDTPLAIKHLV